MAGAASFAKQEGELFEGAVIWLNGIGYSLGTLVGLTLFFIYLKGFIEDDQLDESLQKIAGGFCLGL